MEETNKHKPRRRKQKQHQTHDEHDLRHSSKTTKWKKRPPDKRNLNRKSNNLKNLNLNFNSTDIKSR